MVGSIATHHFHLWPRASILFRPPSDIDHTRNVLAVVNSAWSLDLNGRPVFLDRRAASEAHVHDQLRSTLHVELISDISDRDQESSDLWVGAWALAQSESVGRPTGNT
jgi:hypothetical protein